jgi:hypothetical protein
MLDVLAVTSRGAGAVSPAFTGSWRSDGFVRNHGLAWQLSCITCLPGW